MQVKEVCSLHCRIFDSDGGRLGRIFVLMLLNLARNNGELLLEERGCPVWSFG